MITFTTLNAIREHSPCASGWGKLLAFLGKTKADDDPLALSTILESNGTEDAIWCLRALNGKDKEIRLFAVECVEQVRHLLTDKRSLDALEVAKRYANTEATEEEITEARTEAYAVAYAAAYVAAHVAERAAYSEAYATYTAAHAAAHTTYTAAADAAYSAYTADAEAKSIQKEIFLKYFG